MFHHIYLCIRSFVKNYCFRRFQYYLSDFWAGGKFCYDDPILRKELIYLPNNRESYCKKEIPQQFKNKEHNRTVTRISEYSNALYNGGVFKNPQFLSC